MGTGNFDETFKPGKIIFKPSTTADPIGQPTDDPTAMDTEALGLDFKALGSNFGNDRVKQAEKELYDAIETHLDAVKRDLINHPPHYTSSPAKCSCGEQIECIQIVEHMPFCEGNAMKYLWRCGLKDGANRLDDLRKASWYIQRAIELERGKEK